VPSEQDLTSTESSLRLRRLKRKEFLVLNLDKTGSVDHLVFVCQGAKVLPSPDSSTRKRSKVFMSIIRVLVVEDYEPMRKTIRATLQKRLDLQIIGEASDGLEAVQKAEELSPDLILMDIGLPSQNGIEAARQIRNLVPEAKILYLSQETSPEVIQEALSVSASGYLVKVNAGIELVPAIDAIISGEQSVSQI